MGADNAVLIYRAELPADGFNRNFQEISQFRALDGQRQYGRFRRFACIGAGKARGMRDEHMNEIKQLSRIVRPSAYPVQSPSDLKAFCAKLAEEILEARHEHRLQAAK